MKTQSSEEKIKSAFADMLAEVQVPAVESITARNLVKPAKPLASERPDIISLFANFLNLKVRLIHVILLTALLWIGYLLAQKEPNVHPETANRRYESGLASTNNSTVMCSINTFIVKK
jgi:hypothetical protein